MPDGAFGRGIWTLLRQLGLVGVDLLFVLSGFLVGGALLREAKTTGRVRVGRFLARRLLRLWPAYLLAVLLAWRWYHLVSVSDDAGVVRGAAWWEMWPYLAHVQNYYNLSLRHFGAAAVLQTWQVAALVHFYVIAALVVATLAAVARRTGLAAMRAIPWCVALCFAGCLWARWRAAPAGTYVYDAWRNYFPTHLRLDEPMFGLLLAYAVEHGRERVLRLLRGPGAGLIIAAGLATLIPIALRRQEAARFLVIWGYTLAGVGCGAFVLVAWGRAQTRGLRIARPSTVERAWRSATRAVACVGACGYSIALWHQPLVEHVGLRVRGLIGDHLVRWTSPWNFSAAMAAYVALCVATGALMFFAFERPMLAIRNRLFTNDAPRPPTRRKGGRTTEATPPTPPRRRRAA